MLNKVKRKFLCIPDGRKTEEHVWQIDFPVFRARYVVVSYEGLPEINYPMIKELTYDVTARSFNKNKFLDCLDIIKKESQEEDLELVYLSPRDEQNPSIIRYALIERNFVEIL